MTEPRQKVSITRWALRYPGARVVYAREWHWHRSRNLSGIVTFRTRAEAREYRAEWFAGTNLHMRPERVRVTVEPA